MKGTVLITGANGFVGRALSSSLAEAGFSLRAAVRDEAARATVESATDVFVGPLEGLSKSADLFEGLDAVVHCAARVHRMGESGLKGLEEARRVNRDLTASLARAAREAGVPKFIFLSTVKVMGDCPADPDHLTDEKDTPRPDDAYGISKYEAEEALRGDFEQGGASRCVILRLPMLYGPGSKGNALTLLKAAARGVRLPLGAAKGKRSMLFIGNLCDLVRTIVEDGAPARPAVQTFFVTDGEDLTSAELYARMFSVFHERDGVFAVPVWSLRALGRCASAMERLIKRPLPVSHRVMSRLLDAYKFSPAAFCQEYSWSPPFTASEGVTQMASWYKKARSKT